VANTSFLESILWLKLSLDSIVGKLRLLSLDFQLPPIENPIPIVGKDGYHSFHSCIFMLQQIVDFKTLGSHCLELLQNDCLFVLYHSSQRRLEKQSASIKSYFLI
jgi:hypothetical protein